MVVTDADDAGKNLALTSTGMIAPVARLNGRWPRTLKSDAISPASNQCEQQDGIFAWFLHLPLCEVTEIHV
jgi:hypothetical protein